MNAMRQMLMPKYSAILQHAEITLYNIQLSFSNFDTQMALWFLFEDRREIHSPNFVCFLFYNNFNQFFRKKNNQKPISIYSIAIELSNAIL